MQPLESDGAGMPSTDRLPLHAGPLTMVYAAGDLRYIALQGRELVRRLYVAVRDQNWHTIPATLRDVQIERDTHSFRIRYTAEHRRNDIHFTWQAHIEGDSDGNIRFAMDGQARSTFLRNRIGFCVLHPIRECAGQPCVLEHPDGSREQSAFPQFIAPHQPFFDLRAIRHELLPGVQAELRFAGDIFETEDQRNWTDASFKTYCTPLRLPYPVEIAAGTTISQAVELQLYGALPTLSPPSSVLPGLRNEGTPPSSVLSLQHSALNRPLPSIGVGLASHAEPLSARAIELLRTLRPAHLRADLRMATTHWRERLEQAHEESQTIGAPLELAVFLSHYAADELAALRAALNELQPSIARWLVFSDDAPTTPASLLELARAHLVGYASAPIGGGTNHYFTQLNRARPEIAAFDLVSYSINPQVHAFDHASLVENLAAQAETVASARQFCGDRPIVISPVTLLPRNNPDATDPASLPALPPADPRQPSFFAAAWTLGSIKYLAESGASSVTYYETTGPRGLLDNDTPFPLYQVLAEACAFAGGTVVSSISSDPLLFEGVVLRKADQLRVLLASFAAEPQHVRVEQLGSAAWLRPLDATTTNRDDHYVTQNGALDLTLLPNSIVCIDTQL